MNYKLCTLNFELCTLNCALSKFDGFYIAVMLQHPVGAGILDIAVESYPCRVDIKPCTRIAYLAV